MSCLYRIYFVSTSYLYSSGYSLLAGKLIYQLCSVNPGDTAVWRGRQWAWTA